MTNDVRQVVHELKTWPAYFDAVESGAKRFEVRRDDRDFQMGDTVRLKEYDHLANVGFTGRELSFRIGYVLRGFLPEHVVFALEPLTAQPAPSGWQQRIREAFEAGFCARPKNRESWVGHEVNGTPREWEFSLGGSADDLMLEAWQAWQNAVDAGQPAKDALPPQVDLPAEAAQVMRDHLWTMATEDALPPATHREQARALLGSWLAEDAALPPAPPAGAMKATLSAILALDASGQCLWLETLLVRDQTHVGIIKAAEVAVSLWEQTYAAHDEWCGHRKGSPGNGIFRDAQQATVAFRGCLDVALPPAPEGSPAKETR